MVLVLVAGTTKANTLGLFALVDAKLKFVSGKSRTQNLANRKQLDMFIKRLNHGLEHI